MNLSYTYRVHRYIHRTDSWLRTVRKTSFYCIIVCFVTCLNCNLDSSPCLLDHRVCDLVGGHQVQHRSWSPTGRSLAAIWTCAWLASSETMTSRLSTSIPWTRPTMSSFLLARQQPMTRKMPNECVNTWRLPLCILLKWLSMHVYFASSSFLPREQANLRNLRTIAS